MGLKPTQYRSASESLLRRFRKESSLPPIHPLVDLCNAVSLAFAIPVAVFDVAKVAEHLDVRYATGSEIYETFPVISSIPARARSSSPTPSGARTPAGGRIGRAATRRYGLQRLALCSLPKPCTSQATTTSTVC
jgi:hypothetical protein